MRNLYTKIILLPIQSLNDKSELQFQLYTKGSFEVNNKQWEQYNFVDIAPFKISLIYRSEIIVKPSPNLKKSFSESNLTSPRQNSIDEDDEEIKYWKNILPQAPFKAFNTEEALESKIVSLNSLKLA